ncbi:ribose-phosphate pyrophosphokinase [Pacificimonas flava]|uniref:Ribose-phosphate pyrophosphokinase n=2 Tax=Pacificimonas TaxID=1960290 RepID=A0A219B925_9SPHN|nr:MULTISPECIES: ribose-phosphate pyrophosphokinase [Pacificimonas]MBZ6378432.1 ribose-phosphate pyrophosphokinase [Pacificimonas aurantium]OWV34268.1 ribose-phosphate pyrophosphokinase [Pacificimonas flava]
MSFLDPDLLRAFLIAAARAGESVTYSEALGSQGFGFSRPKMRALCRLLGDIDSEGRARGEPDLAVLVVRQSDRLPGQGWWTGLGPSEYAGPWEGPEARRYVESLQAEVFSFWAEE